MFVLKVRFSKLVKILLTQTKTPYYTIAFKMKQVSVKINIGNVLIHFLLSVSCQVVKKLGNY